MEIRIIDVPEDDTAEARKGWAYLRGVKDIDFGTEASWVAARVLDDEITWARSHHATVTVHDTGYVNITWPNIPEQTERDQIFQPLHAPARITKAQARDLRELLNAGYGTFEDDRNGLERLDVRILYSIPPSGWTILRDRGWIYDNGGRVYVSFAGRIALAVHEAREAGKRGNERLAVIRAAAETHRTP